MEIELRIILLIVGMVILVVVGIDLYRRRPTQEANESHNVSDAFTSDPMLDSFYDDNINTLRRDQDTSALQYEPVYNFSGELQSDDQLEKLSETSDMDVQTVAEPIPENILTITIRSREPYGFKGADLLKAIKNAHLHFGKNDVFYRHESEDGQGETLFSLVKATEPGYFYLETLLQEHVPGVILILVTDYVSNPQLALDKMVRTAKQMAFSLNAELLDDQRQPLTLETIEKYKRQAQRK
jgi:cell division protein ZipA